MASSMLYQISNNGRRAVLDQSWLLLRNWLLRSWHGHMGCWKSWNVFSGKQCRWKVSAENCSMLLSKYYVMCQIAAYILFCHDCYRFFLKYLHNFSWRNVKFVKLMAFAVYGITSLALCLLIVITIHAMQLLPIASTGPLWMWIKLNVSLYH